MGAGTKVIGLIIVRTLIVLMFAPLLKLFVNLAVNPTVISMLFGTSALTYMQAVYIGAIAAVLSTF